MGRMLILVACLAISAATPVLGQDARVIAPGMTREQVVAELGAPAQARTAGRFAYLFYPNGCERSCGMQDLVILEDDAVVDAIFRSPRRSYSGVSSSPRTAAPGRTTTTGAAIRPSPGPATGRGSIIMANPPAADTARPAAPVAPPVGSRAPTADTTRRTQPQPLDTTTRQQE